MSFRNLIAISVFGALLISFSQNTLAAGPEVRPLLEVSGMDALSDQHINQYDDGVENPPQGYRVTLPKGYTLQAVDVESGGSAICGVSSFNSRTQTLTIDGFSLETDETGCTVILSIYEKATKSVRKVRYEIEQVGT